MVPVVSEPSKPPAELLKYLEEAYDTVELDAVPDDIDLQQFLQLGGP